MVKRLPVIPHLAAAVLLWCLAVLGVSARAGSLPGELPALVGRLNAVAGTVQWRMAGC